YLCRRVWQLLQPARQGGGQPGHYWGQGTPAARPTNTAKCQEVGATAAANGAQYWHRTGTLQDYGRRSHQRPATACLSTRSHGIVAFLAITCIDYRLLLLTIK